MFFHTLSHTARVSHARFHTRAHTRVSHAHTHTRHVFHTQALGMRFTQKLLACISLSSIIYLFIYLFHFAKKNRTLDTHSHTLHFEDPRGSALSAPDGGISSVGALGEVSISLENLIFLFKVLDVI